MVAEGLHGLAYALTLAPEQEILSALDQVAAQSWSELQSLDKLVAKEYDGIAALVDDAPVIATGSGASYRQDNAPLPENYRHLPYDKPQEAATEEVEAVYNFTAGDQVVANVIEQQIDQAIFANHVRISYIEMQPTAELAARVDCYKAGQGLSLSFLRYAMKNASS
jgi:hypothetical protein